MGIGWLAIKCTTRGSNNSRSLIFGDGCPANCGFQSRKLRLQGRMFKFHVKLQGFLPKTVTCRQVLWEGELLFCRRGYVEFP